MSSELESGDIEWKEPSKRKQAAFAGFMGFGAVFAATNLPVIGEIGAGSPLKLGGLIVGAGLLAFVAVFLLAGR